MAAELDISLGTWALPVRPGPVVGSSCARSYCPLRMAMLADIESTGAIVMDMEGTVEQVNFCLNFLALPRRSRSLLVCSALVQILRIMLAQATGELENDNENVARVIYTMLQDSNSIAKAMSVPDEKFQRLSVTFAGFEYVAAISAGRIYVIKRTVTA